MTRDEYLQLIQNSAAFKAMPEDLQARVLAADGPLMAAYARIFEDERTMLQRAKQQFVERSEIIVKNMVAKVKKLKSSKLRKEEERSHREDAAVEAKLLQQMSEL